MLRRAEVENSRAVVVCRVVARLSSERHDETAQAGAQPCGDGGCGKKF